MIRHNTGNRSSRLPSTRTTVRVVTMASPPRAHAHDGARTYLTAEMRLVSAHMLASHSRWCGMSRCSQTSSPAMGRSTHGAGRTNGASKPCMPAAESSAAVEASRSASLARDELQGEGRGGHHVVTER